MATMVYKERMENYVKTIEELSGVKLRFFGCNGEYSCSTFTSFSYLNGYHSRKEICIYLEGVIDGLRRNKK